MALPVAVSPLIHLVMKVLKPNVDYLHVTLKEDQFILTILRSIGGFECNPIHFTRSLYIICLYNVACNLDMTNLFPQSTVPNANLCAMEDRRCRFTINTC